MINSFPGSFFPSVNTVDNTIEGVNAFTLKEEFGTPLFVISKRALKTKISEFISLLKRAFPNSGIAFSMKTNNLAGLNRFFRDNGFLAETVSAYEYWLAKKLEFKKNKIILNGPYKSHDLLRQAITDSALIHIDNFSELATIIKLTNELKKRTSVGIRVNPEVPGRQSRFGFNLKNGDAWKACREIIAGKWLDLAGLHYHLGSNIFSLDHYRQASESVCRFAVKLMAELTPKLEYLDVGGGFPSWGGGGSDISAYLTYSGKYFEAIAKPILNLKLDYLKLIIEPGRSLVDESIILLSTVIHSSLVEKQQNVVVDASLNILPLAQTRKQTIKIISGPSGHSRSSDMLQTTFFGSSCVESDWLAKQSALPLHPEDLIIFYNAGAYNISQANQFINLRPAVIGLSGGKAKVLRRKEVFSDLYRLEVGKL